MPAERHRFSDIIEKNKNKIIGVSLVGSGLLVTLVSGLGIFFVAGGAYVLHADAKSKH